jgi:predicted amidophosphoribosyltransferase
MSEPSGPRPVQCACPGCGRPAVPGLPYCPDCDDGFHIAHCPRCLSVLFRLEGFCPKCGAELSVLYRQGKRSDVGI